MSKSKNIDFMYHFLSNKGHTFVNNVRRTLHPFSKQEDHVDKHITLGHMDEGDELGRSFQTAAQANKKKLKSIIATGIDVEYPNSLHQTPLFCACLKNNDDAAVILLKHGASPNTPDVNGTTPLHVACYKGNIKLVCRMIDSGADLSLRNEFGDGVYEWASRIVKPKKQQAMIEFLDRVRYYGEVLTCYDKDEHCPIKLPERLKRPVRESSIIEMTDYKTADGISLPSVKSDDSHGYGQVYPCPKESFGIVSVVPLISEMMLRNVSNVCYECSLDFTMREMMWIHTPVNVKQLNSEFEVHERAVLILNEAEKCGKLRHPNVLLFMALCQAKTFDTMTLVFELAARQNLYQVLHLEDTELNLDIQMKITRQLCFVLEFIHKQDFIHCALSSRAVYLTSSFDVKLGNFEFMMESRQADKCKSSPLHSYPPASWLYSWMAPEVIMGAAPSFSSDVFSYSCIIWEIFRVTVPWSWISTAELYRLIETGRNIALSIILLPGSLAFLRDSLKLKKEERQGDISVLATLLKPARLSISLFGGNESLNATDDAANLPCSFQNGEYFGAQKRMKQDRLLFDASDGNAQSKDDDQYCDRLSYSLPRENARTKQYSFVEDCPSSESRAYFQKFAKPASHMAQSLSRSTKLDKACRPNAQLKSRHRTDDPGLDGCLRSTETASLSVKELAKHYQQCLNQHKLRQAILRGSMIPHGSCPELDSQSSSLKWNSLPATLRDLSLNTEDSSKTWTMGSDDLDRNASVLGDLSSTPVLKSCSTPEEKDHARMKAPSIKDRNLRCHLFQQRLRDVGVGSDEIRQNAVYNEKQTIFKGGMNIKSISDPENLQRELVNEVKLFQSDASQSPSHRMSPNSVHVDVQNSKEAAKYRTGSVKDNKTAENISKASSQATVGTDDTPESDISWDMTQVTPLETAELTEMVKGNSQEKLNGQILDPEMEQVTKAAQQLSKLHFSPYRLTEKKEALDVLNNTFTVEDGTLEGEKTLTTDTCSDSISRWIDSKLDDIRRKATVQGNRKLQTENDLNLSMDFDEELSKEVIEDFSQNGDYHLLNVKASELSRKTGSSQTSSICEFEFQEFYIDDDLSNGIKDHPESSEMKENLNSHVNYDDQATSAAPPVSSIELRCETENELPRGLPPPAVVKPKRRGIKWRKNLSQSAATTLHETDLSLSPIAKKRETFSEANLVSKTDYESSCRGIAKVDAHQARLNSGSSERLEDKKGEPNITSKLISFFEDGVKIEKASKKLKKPDGKGEKHESENLKWAVEDTPLAATEVKQLNTYLDSQYGERKMYQSLCLDKSTEMDTENENIVFQRLQDQEIQVCSDLDNLESDEWVNERLRIIQDKIKRRKHRLVYCISSDEDDAEDKQNDEEKTGICFPDIHDNEESESNERPFEAREHLMSQQMSTFETLQALPSPTQPMQTWPTEHSLSDGFAKGDSVSWPMKNGTDLRLQSDPSNPCGDLHKSEKPLKQERFVSRKKRTFPGFNRNNCLKDKEGDGSIRKNAVADCAESVNYVPLFSERDRGRRSNLSDRMTSPCSLTDCAGSAAHDPFHNERERGIWPNLSDEMTSPSKGQRSLEAETLVPRKVSFSHLIDQSPPVSPQQTSESSQKCSKSYDNFNALAKWQILSETNNNICRSPKITCKQESQTLPQHLRPSRNYSDNEECFHDQEELSSTSLSQNQDKEIALAADYDESQEDQKDHCLILDLRYPHDGKTTNQSPSNRSKDQSGLHKFYLPKERWSNGCQARLHVQLSPTNPHRHHVTTTAFDPESGHSEILLEETVVTNSLKSSFNLQ